MPSKSTKNKIRISVTIIPTLDNMLTRIAKKSGQSKSCLVELALSNYLKNKFEDDIAALAKMKFDDLPSEDDWLMLQSDIT